MKDRRSTELAKIHLGAKQLGLDDDAYRAMLWTVARVRSARDLDEGGRRAVLEHMKARGFKTRRKGRPTPSDDRGALLAKIDAQLAAAGRDRDYVERGMLRRMLGPEAPARLDWCTPEQLRKITAALWYDARRKGRQV